MTYLATNIRYLRQKNGMSQEELSRRLNKKSYTTVQKWESGVAEPPVKVVNQLSQIFGVSMSDLTGTDLRYITSGASRSVRIPVYARVSAGIPIDAIEEVIDYEEIPEMMARNNEYFGLRIRGNSMEPKISDGDVVIVRKQSDADDGDTVIALVNGNEGCCKRLKKYETGCALISTNPAYDPLYFTRAEMDDVPVRILGKVVELRAKF